MKMPSVPPRPLLIVAASLSLLAACSRQQASPQESAAVAPVATSAPATGNGEAMRPGIAEFRTGRYIEPKTYVLGGVGTRFKPGDKLFATVRLAGITGPSEVSVRLTDGTGAVLVEQTHLIPPNGIRANFSLTPKTGALAPGQYTVEASLDGKPAQKVAITVE